MKYACEIMQKQMKSLRNLYKIQYYMFISLQYKSSKYTTSQHHRWPASLLMSKGADILLYYANASFQNKNIARTIISHQNVHKQKNKLLVNINDKIEHSRQHNFPTNSCSRRTLAHSRLVHVLGGRQCGGCNNIYSVTIFIWI